MLELFSVTTTIKRQLRQSPFKKLLLDFRSWFLPRKITFLIRTLVPHFELRKQCAHQIQQSSQVSSHQSCISFRTEPITVASLLNALALQASRLTRDGTAEPVSRDQILRHARGQGNVHFPCSADHEQDWQPYPVDPFSAICDDHTYKHDTVYSSVPGIVDLSSFLSMIQPSNTF